MISRPSFRRPGSILLVVAAVVLGGCASVEERRLEQVEKARFFYEEGEREAELGDDEQAIEAYTRAIAHHPAKFPAAHFARANAHRRQGNFEDAIEDYTRAIRSSRGYDAALYNRAETFRRLERWAPALRDFQAYLDENPSDPRPILRIGYILYERVPSRHSEALAYLKRYLQMAGPDPMVEGWVLALELDVGPIEVTPATPEDEPPSEPDPEKEE